MQICIHTHKFVPRTVDHTKQGKKKPGNITFNTFTEKKHSTDENTMWRSVRATGYGKLGFAEVRTHWNTKELISRNQSGHCR
jgi:hypothetical protein